VDAVTEVGGAAAADGPRPADPAPADLTSADPAGTAVSDRSGSGLRPIVAAILDPATYRAALGLVLLLPLGIVGFVWVVATLAIGIGLSITLVGIPIVAVSLVGARQIAAVGRRLARWGFKAKIATPPPLVRGSGLLGWLSAVLLDAVNWRSVLFLVVMLPMGIVSAVVTVVLAVASILSPILIAAPLVVRALAATNRWLAERLLAPVTLSERVRRLQNRRRQVLESAADERRRIERDLHDGAQARLVALAMDLGMAKEKLAGGSDPERAATLVASAHDEVKRALSELRDLTRGIHPAVLTDRGLDAALSAVAARCTVPVVVSVEVPQRPSQATEQIAYYCVSELLVNVSRHSHAGAAAVTARRGGDLLLLDVRDDGVGGADPAQGTGLRGLAERVGSAGGRFTVESPAGGPTVVSVELPCAS
jgi:signal transduction histidine kinase